MAGSSPTVGNGGLLSTLFPELANNPVYQGINSNRYTLQGLFNGLASGTPYVGPTPPAGDNIMQNAIAGAQQGRQSDIQLQRLNQTVQWLQQTDPQAAALVAGGMPVADVFAMKMKNTVIPPGSSVMNDATGKITGGQDSNAPYGNDIKSWAYRTLQTADPSSQEYAQAANIIQTQTVTLQPDGKGGMVQVVNQQPLPVGFAPPTYGQQSQSQPQAPTAQSSGMPAVADRIQQLSQAQPPGVDFTGQAPAQQGAPGQMGGAVSAPIPGIVTQRAAPNESTNRIDMLSKMMISDVPTAIANFSALQSQKDQLLQKDPTGLTNFMKDSKYQQAYAGLNGVISNVLYTVSGAAIGDKEMERKVVSMSPQIGDSTATAVDKLRRFSDYVNSAAFGSNNPDTVNAAKEATSQVSAVVGQMTRNDPIPVDTPQQAKALPHGAYFKDPNGIIRLNP